MSRVDDDRDAARLAERQAELRRLEDEKKAGRAKDSAFSRLVAKGKEDGDRAATRREGGKATGASEEKKSTARRAIDALLKDKKAIEVRDSSEEPTLPPEVGGHRAGDEAAVEGQGRNLAEHANEARDLGGQLSKRRGESDASRRAEAKGRLDDKLRREDVAASRKADGDVGRGVAAGRDAEHAEGAAGAAEKGLEHDQAVQEKGGGKDSGSGGGGAGAGGGPGFRFNPALMAPVPIAKQKDLAGSDRLRRIANEIAQKIVERVRVGTNALGHSEFQIDLRNNVLGGLSVKVSAHGGKIRAVFKGSDKEVMKLLKDGEASLKAALEGRGLTLEDFVIEANA